MKDAIKLPRWVPSSIRDRVQISQSGKEKVNRTETYYLMTDDRMQDVWQWYESAINEANGEKEGLPLDALHLLFVIQKALRMPGKPGDMTPKRREQYFQKVRTHVAKLKELLSDTKFDQDWRIQSYPLQTEQLEDDFRGQFLPPGAYEFEYMASYLFNAGHVSRAPHDFPECALMELLDRITEWTEEEDYWDRGEMDTSKGIRQQSSRTPVIRFTCLVYWEHLRYGISFPARHLATLANVVFQLPDDKPLDEDVVRKQTARFIEQHGQPKTMLDCEF